MSSFSDTIKLARQLIQRQSVTPEDAGCQQLMMKRLEKLGFALTPLAFNDVSNFWAIRGEAGPILCFAGHTDVVPTGDVEHWQQDPFAAQIIDGMLYGRGAADMKGSLAAMLTACERFVDEHRNHPGRIAFLITSDEEGPAVDGTVRVMEYLHQQGEHIDWCVVGEPSSTKQMGDTIKNGRRGSLNASLQVHGQQGHVAYPQFADNPIHRLSPALTELASTEWDQGNEFFPATTFQVSNINGGTGVTNVIPGTVNVLFNFRYSTESTADALKKQVQRILDRHELNYSIDWQLSGEPFLTAKGDLVNAASTAVETITGNRPELSTGGGTSDGRFIAPYGTEVVELGPCNGTIHKIDECVTIAELDQLSLVYQQMIERLLLNDG